MIKNTYAITVIKLLIIVILYYLYQKSACYLDLDVICHLSKGGYILIIAYCISTTYLVCFLKDYHYPKRILFTLLLYCISYAILAFPYLIASVFQPLEGNVFIHSIIIIAIVELISTKLETNSKQ